VSAFLVAAIYAYKLTSKEILPLFILQGMSMWMTTMCLPALLSFVRNNESAEKARSSAVKFQWLLNLGFMLAFASAFFAKGAHCDAAGGIVIPWGFYITFVLFMA
jgi:hypothetical protein